MLFCTNIFINSSWQHLLATTFTTVLFAFIANFRLKNWINIERKASLTADLPRNKLMFVSKTKSPESFWAHMLFCASLWTSSISKNVSQKARQCSDILGDLLCETELKRSPLMFSGFKLHTYNTFLIHELPCLILQCFHILSRLVKSPRTIGCSLEWTGKVAHLQQQNITYSITE